MKIWAHTLVRNEERYLWYAVSSVVNYVDRVMIWDTGSEDNTVEIARELRKEYGRKIEVKQLGKVDINRFTRVRQQMLEETKSDWFFILDGDEVWWDDSIIGVIREIGEKGGGLDSIVSGYYNVVGDIFHYQEEAAGRYSIDGETGHLTIRAMNRHIKGLRFERPHGQQAIVDGRGKPIQEMDSKRRVKLPGKYMHFTNVIRSNVEMDALVPKRAKKLKHELGKSLPLDFYYPEVFFRPRPSVVESVWRKMDGEFYYKSAVATPLRKFKRRFFSSGKVGY